jgi:predicted small secreted protein
MTRREYLILNTVGGLCAVVILLNFTMVQLNGRLSQKVAVAQEVVNSARSYDGTWKNLIEAARSSTDPVIRAMLVRRKIVLPEAPRETPKR